MHHTLRVRLRLEPHYNFHHYELVQMTCTTWRRCSCDGVGSGPFRQGWIGCWFRQGWVRKVLPGSPESAPEVRKVRQVVREVRKWPFNGPDTYAANNHMFRIFSHIWLQENTHIRGWSFGASSGRYAIASNMCGVCSGLQSRRNRVFLCLLRMLFGLY